MSTAYLARWIGPVSESDDPYNPSSNVSPSGLPIRKHLQEVLIVPDRANSLDNENIKQAIMTYGALYTHMYWDAAYYNSTYKAYYYNGQPAGNHAVAIVGWDDDFDKTKFSNIPSGNGAFIIRNSWGTSWGENGYFYISYYDTVVGTSNYLFNWAESTTNYNTIYQYDPFGWISSLGYGSNTAWFANVFTSVSDDLLKAVSFYTSSPSSTYEIYIYRNATSGPVSGTLAGSKTETILSPGYHTIPLDSPVPLTLGQKFSVVVRLTTPGYNYPIPFERPLSNYSSQAAANAGESYISSNGSGWSDLTVNFANSNVCLKAFTTPDTTAPTIQITVPTSNPTYSTTQQTINIGGTASDNAGVTQVTWFSNQGGAGTASGTTSWSVSGIPLFSGENNITVTAYDAANNQGYDTITVTYAAPENISTPNTPSGTTSGLIGTSYAYTTGGSTADSGHQVQYRIDWGDGTNSDWLPVGTTSASHSWGSPGTYLVKAQARCATHPFIVSSWSEAFSVKISIIILQSPSSSTVFDSCALITNYQPTFGWTAAGSFSGFKILFSTSPTDFTTAGIKVAAGSATGTSNSWKPSSFNWKAIMKASYNNGSIRPIYWKVVGTKTDKTTVQSEVRSINIGTPQTVTINAPLDTAILDPATLPTFDFDTNCNTKFTLQISSLSDFSVSTKMKAFNFTVSNPNLVPALQKTLPSFQWTSVKKLIGTGTGYFRIKAWDGLSRPTVSEVRTFSVQ
jgi:hypothetical protein